MTCVADAGDFRREVLEAEGPVLALFLADWCPFCLRFLPLFREAQGPDVRRVEVDLSDDDNPLWEAYGIQVVPTLLLFEDGRVVDRADGRFLRGLREADLDRLRARVRG